MNLSRKQQLAIIWVIIAFLLFFFNDNLTAAVVAVGVANLLVV